MRRLKNRLKQNRISLEYTKKAVQLLAQLGFDPTNGARPVKRMIDDMVKKEIAFKVLKRDFVEEDTIFIDVDQTNKKLVIKKQARE